MDAGGTAFTCQADSASVQTNMGLQVDGSGRVGMLTTCANDRVLRYDTGSSTWGCSQITNAMIQGPVSIANGGTGAGTVAGARTNLGAAGSGANSDITSLSGLTTALSVAQGGTGSTTQNFVDLSTAQSISGVKTFNSTITGSVSGSAASFTGSLAGDVTGTQGSNTVTRLQNRAVLGAAPSDGSLLAYDTGNAAWAPSSVSTPLAHNGLALSLTNCGPNQIYQMNAGGTAWGCNNASTDGFVGNEVTGAANGTLSRTGAGTAVDPFQLALNLGSTNTWTSQQTFGGGAALSDGTRLDVSGTGTIVFPNVDATNATTPMISMQTSATSSAQRMVLGHSPSFPTWGLAYEDSSDTFRFLASGSTVMHVGLAQNRIGLGTDTFTGLGERLNVNGTVKTNERIRLGSETGNTEAPRVDSSGGYQGMVVRRINSTSNAAAVIVASTDQLALRRPAGTNQQFEMVRVGTGQRGYVSCNGVNAGGGMLGSVINSPAGDLVGTTYVVYAEGSNMMMINCQFGTLDTATSNVWHHATVQMSRTNTGSYWVGTLTSTYNQ
jgi:hypothetical protein